MYLADALLRSTSNEKSVRQFRTIMDDAELYAVETSAMTLCQDLRLESPGQMERIVEILCTQNRKVFAEVATAQIAPLLSRLTLLQEEWFTDLKRKFPRLGVLIVPSNGILRLSLSWINGENKPKKWNKEWLEQVAGAGNWTATLSGLEPYEHRTSEAMVAAAFHDPGVSYSIAAFQNTGIERDEAIRLAWMTNRIMSLGGNGPKAHGYDGVMRVMAIAMAISLGAILQIEAPELDRSKRQPRTTPQSGQKSRQIEASENSRVEDDRLSIVTLRLSDREMQRVYQTPASAERKQSNTKARHLVRGHVFATRWGGIAWRKPHWRGDPNKKVLRRVI